MKPFVLLCCVAGLLSACGKPTDRPAPPTVSVDNPIPFTKEGVLDFLRDDGSFITSIDIEVADSDSARTRGLMQRTGLPSNSGMLFIFQQQRTQTFWMANTPIALDMIFVDQDSVIVDIAKYVRPQNPETTASKAPAMYVIEVVAGFTDSQGITETDRVTWSRMD